MKWIETTEKVYLDIYETHKSNFGVFGTITDTTGDGPHGNGKRHIMTEWGFHGADYPILKCETRGEIHKYYLALVEKEECEHDEAERLSQEKIKQETNSYMEVFDSFISQITR